MLENKQEKLLAIQKEFVNKKEKEWEGLESKHLIVLHLLFELDFYCLNNSLVDKFFNPNSLEMLDDKIEVLNALKDGKKQDEIPKFYDVLEFLNDDNVCNKDEDKLFDNDKEKIDDYFETEKAREIENYFKEAMKNFKKDIKKIKKEKSKNKCKKEKTSKKIKKDKLEKKANKKNKKSKNKSKKAKKKNKK